MILYTIEAYYPDAVYLPTNTVNPMTGVFGPESRRIKKLSITEIVNRLFNGEHDAFFEHKYTQATYPEYITLKSYSEDYKYYFR